MEVVYFIYDSINNAIKIGYTKNINVRIKNLQTSNPNKLTIFGYVNGGRELEKILHDRFKAYKISGEWFRVNGNDELIDYINTNNVMFVSVEVIDGKLYVCKKMKRVK